MSVQLSENFTINEFTRSNKAEGLGRVVEVESGSAVDLNLHRLCRIALQPIRNALGLVIVSSGFRPPWLNKAVGGSKTSDHQYGLAADINVRGYTPLAVSEWIAANIRGVNQIIHEHGRWVHVSIWPEGQSGETKLLTAYKPLPTAENPHPKTIYVNGLHEINKLREQAA